MTRRDWFTFADPLEAAAELAKGPDDLPELAPGVWGLPGIAVVCLGDHAHMRKVQAKRFADKFHADICPLGYYGPDHGGPPIPSVAERIGEMMGDSK